MNLTHLTNAECGQSSPLVQMAEHLTQDHAHQDQINSSAFQHPNSSSTLPQSFRMKDLFQEINEIESQGAVGYTSSPSATWATQYQNPIRHPEPHQARICEQLPQPMHLPQYHRMELPYAHQPEGISQKLQRELSDSLLESTEVSAYNKDEYKVIQSLDELADCQENNQPRQVDINPNLIQESSSEKTIEEKVETETEKPTKEDFKSKKLTPLEMGKMYLSKGDRTEAIVRFEAALNLDRTCVEAWTLLGIARMENVQPIKALKALYQGLKLDRRNLDILMTLALMYSGYSSEHNKYQSFLILCCWLKYHPEYKDIFPTNFKIKGIDQFSTGIKELQDLFIKAARRRPIDHDHQVQSALGILFNLSGEFSKAVDCYRSALLVKPRDARLWNRLGVTFLKLENCKEEMESFRRALKLDPNLTCTHSNIGLTYMNAYAYREAAEHFLIALNLQTSEIDGGTSTDDTCDGIWSYLNKCLSYMDLPELQLAAAFRDLKTLNESFDVIKM